MNTQPKELATPDQIADYLLLECRERGDILTNLKLQKLIYYAQAWHLAFRGQQIFEEDFQAWVHGPVAPSQYHRFKEFSWRPILTELSRPQLSEELANYLDEIIDNFAVESATALELMTHQETPWIEARGDLPPDENCEHTISKDTMQHYYKSMINE